MRIKKMRNLGANRAVGKHALSLVRKFFPKVNRVKDAHENIIVEVTKKDNDSATVRNHESCAMAVACRRKMRSDGVIISIRTAYVVDGRVATRYRVPESVSREIVSFDRHGGFAVGDYVLRAPNKYEQLGYTGSGRTHNPSDRKRPKYKHMTSGIRTVLGGSKG